MSNQFLSGRFLGSSGDFDKSELIIVGLPFDGTTSYLSGSRFAPNHIRLASDSLETFSPYQKRNLEKVTFCDIGDMNLPSANAAPAHKIIKDETGKLLRKEKKIIGIGGEHSVSYPSIEAYHERYSSLQVVVFDAHADLREDYEGERLSHASVMRRVGEKIGFENLYQLGIRSGTEAEFSFGETLPHFNPFNLDALNSYITQIGERPLYLSLDIDILDPGILPGTSCPEPGGLDFASLIGGLLKLENCNLVGADITEVNPQNDPSGISSITAAKLIRELLLLISGQ